MKDRKIIVIKLIAGSNTPIKEEINDELEVYQEFVGGNIEIVSLGERLAMVVNDEGLIRELPENMIASILYWSRCGRVVTPICGNAMLVGIRPEDEGEFGSVPNHTGAGQSERVRADHCAYQLFTAVEHSRQDIPFFFFRKLGTVI